jgi:GH24 family phage-related lysozyme (muramidase)
MKISQNGIDLIKCFEGCRFNPYRDAGGLWTVGYGHLIGDGKSLPSGYNRIFTQKEIDDFLVNDLMHVESGISVLIRVSITQNQFDALCSFCYNLGMGTLQKSTLLKDINSSLWGAAANDILKFHFASGVSLPGLVKRRQAEHDLFIKE